MNCMNEIGGKRPTLRMKWVVIGKGGGVRALVPTTAKSKASEPERMRPINEIAVGDWLQLELQSDMDGYLHFFDFDTDGDVRKLFPCAELSTVDNHIKAAKPYTAPGNLLPIKAFEVSGSTTAESGRKERLLVVVTRKPVDLSLEAVSCTGAAFAARGAFSAAEEAVASLTDLPDDEWTYGLLEAEVIHG